MAGSIGNEAIAASNFVEVEVEAELEKFNSRQKHAILINIKVRREPRLTMKKCITFCQYAISYMAFSQ